MILCHLGCNQEAKYINKSGKHTCEKSSSSCPAMKKINSQRLKDSYESGSRKSAKLLYQDMPKETKDKMAWNRGKYTADFSLNGIGSHKQVLLRERGHACESCGLSEWKNVKIPIELEHCDGNNRNNSKENLLLLCPNCHALTKFYRGRNINKGHTIVDDISIISAFKEHGNVRKTLIAVGMTPKGGNYDRVYAILDANGISR